MSALNIFGYTDYRHFLRDYYALQKMKNRSFSYRQFATRAKLGSANYLKLVIDGSRRVTDQNMSQFIRGLKLDAVEADYFRLLVRYAETKDPEEKKSALERAHQIKESLEFDATRLVPLSFKIKSSALTQFIKVVEEMSCADEEDAVEVHLHLRGARKNPDAKHQGDINRGGESS